ncbi:hypothetical protein [Nonomuraea jiangxiensis]|uniref:Uncharacterized protein n=1 Tax=Nonomuraea jiangxiensis TaxID=633440 RepID=A0A1G8LD49_9ACTN|nr:hypothetical protein [Nonomuraea jiangxiensis]SDI53387.1 hypothetical protein SAMN05421869_10655 [Nonomuraea jiangxiensis]
MRADPRVLRVAAAVTTPVLASVLVTEGVRLPAVARRSLRSTHSMLPATPVKGAPKETEDARGTPAAFLEAACGFRHGCETYLLDRRLLPAANMEVS